MNCYNLEGIKTYLQKELDRSKAFTEAWMKVTFPTKKDGKPFSVLSKNIEGARFARESNALQEGENTLTVHSFAESLGYIYEDIKLYEIVRYMKDDTKRAKMQNYAPKQQYLEQIYVYDLDDIKQAVADRADYWKNQVKALTESLERVESVYNSFKQAYTDAMNLLNDATKDFDQCSILKYAVCDTIKARYPYC